MSEYTDGTYTIYSEHVGSCDEAERMATTLQALYPSVQFIVLHGVEGCGAGYAGDNEALGLSIDTVYERYTLDLRVCRLLRRLKPKRPARYVD